jgi:ABC-type multidrug transport system permease subunit
MAYTEPEPETKTPLGLAGWLAIAVMAALLVAAILFAIHTWDAMAGTSVSTLGWVFMALGVIVTTLVGAGLMALVFYSSRKNYDR